METVEVGVQVVEHVGVGWQPMDTAPKDGTVIIVYLRIHGEKTLCIVQWVSNDYTSASGSWFTSDGLIMQEERMTHWMPAPEPPQEEDVLES